MKDSRWRSITSEPHTISTASRGTASARACSSAVRPSARAASELPSDRLTGRSTRHAELQKQAGDLVEIGDEAIAAMHRRVHLPARLHPGGEVLALAARLLDREREICLGIARGDAHRAHAVVEAAPAGA